MISEYLKSIKKPKTKYLPRPLWFWNGKITPEKTREIMQKSKEESLYSGFGILGCDSCSLDYMQDNYMEAYGVALECAKNLDLKMCLYDEWWFPSGNVNGELQKKYPNHCAKRLDKEEFSIESGKTFEKELFNGKLMSAVAMNMSTLERINLSDNIKNNVLSWQAPSENWKVMLFYCVLDGWDRVDYLSPTAVEKFIELTHEKYYDRFSEYFGNVIDSSFYDEPQFYSTQGRMWTDDFNEKFENRYGYSPELLYPSLWYDIGR